MYKRQLELRGQAPELTAANALTGRRPLHRAKVWRWSLASLAAALALSVVGLILWLPGAWPVWFSDYHTNSGEQQTVQMADGSQIFLNVETAIAVDFSSERREVELLHGEAFFEVAPDPHRPFRVRARAGVITAQGTAFTVRIQRDEVTVAVTEGAVSVSPGLSGSVTSPLEAGWQASYRGGQMAPAHRAHLLRLLAWRRGQLVFQMQPLGEVIEEVSRYGAGTIVIANPWLRDLVVSGVFDIATPDRVLDAVEKTLQVRRLRVTGRLTFLY